MGYIQTMVVLGTELVKQFMQKITPYTPPPSGYASIVCISREKDFITSLEKQALAGQYKFLLYRPLQYFVR